MNLLFLESCRSEETKHHYSFCLKKYFGFAGELSFNNCRASNRSLYDVSSLSRLYSLTVCQ